MNVHISTVNNPNKVRRNSLSGIFNLITIRLAVGDLRFIRTMTILWLVQSFTCFELGGILDTLMP